MPPGAFRSAGHLAIRNRVVLASRPWNSDFDDKHRGRDMTTQRYHVFVTAGGTRDITSKHVAPPKPVQQELNF